MRTFFITLELLEYEQQSSTDLKPNETARCHKKSVNKVNNGNYGIQCSHVDIYMTLPRVIPSSNSLTVFALAARGILYSPPMSSNRGACLEKSKILAMQITYEDLNKYSDMRTKNRHKVLLLKNLAERTCKSFVIDIVKTLMEIFICDDQIERITQGHSTRKKASVRFLQSHSILQSSDE